MGEESLGHPDIHIGDGEEEGGGLLGAAGVARLELLNVLERIARKESPALGEFVQMPHCQLKDVSLLQLGHILPFRLEGHRHDVFKLKRFQ